MTCQHDLDHLSDEYYSMPECDLHVECDRRCKALTRPETIEELRAALRHWEHHSYLSGCSHGC